MDHEREDILWECHYGVAGGHISAKPTTENILQAGLWWPTVHKDIKAFVKKCDVCKITGCPSHRDKLPLQPIREMQPSEKWVIYFIGPVALVTRHSQARYIITATNYLTRWVKEELVKDCTTDTVAKFIFEIIITRFGCPRSLTSDQGTHFINTTIKSVLDNFMVQHHKSSQYHPQENGIVEAFNKIL